MDWRDVRRHGRERGPAFYLTLLEYGQYLWQRRRAARALLCLDRAFGADLTDPGAAGIPPWPPPYAAVAWLLARTPADVFIGNPRVHYQHLAGRVRAPRGEQRRWRAWACWAIARRVLPDLPGDPRCGIDEPDEDRIDHGLVRHGSPAERECWRRVLENLICDEARLSPVAD